LFVHSRHHSTISVSSPRAERSTRAVSPRTRPAARDGISRRDLHIYPTVTGDKLQHVADKRYYAARDPNEAPSQWGSERAHTQSSAVSHVKCLQPRARSVDAYAKDAPLLGLPLSPSPPRVIWGGTISSGRPTSASPQPRSRRPGQWWCRRSEAVDPMGQAAALLCQGLHNCVPEVTAVRAEGGSPTCHRLQPRS